MPDQKSSWTWSEQHQNYYIATQSKTGEQNFSGFAAQQTRNAASSKLIMELRGMGLHMGAPKVIYCTLPFLSC